MDKATKTCLICRKPFVNLVALEQHMVSKHGDLPQDQTRFVYSADDIEDIDPDAKTCNKCMKTFHSNDALLQHYEVKHPGYSVNSNKKVYASTAIVNVAEGIDGAYEDVVFVDPNNKRVDLSGPTKIISTQSTDNGRLRDINHDNQHIQQQQDQDVSVTGKFTMLTMGTTHVAGDPILRTGPDPVRAAPKIDESREEMNLKKMRQYAASIKEQQQPGRYKSVTVVADSNQDWNDDTLFSSQRAFVSAETAAMMSDVNQFPTLGGAPPRKILGAGPPITREQAKSGGASWNRVAANPPPAPVADAYISQPVATQSRVNPAPPANQSWAPAAPQETSNAPKSWASLAAQPKQPPPPSASSLPNAHVQPLPPQQFQQQQQQHQQPQHQPATAWAGLPNLNTSNGSSGMMTSPPTWDPTLQASVPRPTRPRPRPAPETQLLQFRPGELVEARYTADGVWYKAQIEGLFDNGQYLVLYTEYGNRELLPSDAVRARSSV